MSEEDSQIQELQAFQIRLGEILAQEEAAEFGCGRAARQLRSYGLGMAQLAADAEVDPRTAETVSELLGIYGHCEPPLRPLIVEALQAWGSGEAFQAPDLDEAQTGDELHGVMSPEDSGGILPASATPADPVTVLRGVGPAMARRLEQLGIHTLLELLFHLPRRYEAYENLTLAQVQVGQTVSVMGRVEKGSVATFRFGKSVRKQAVKARLRDGTGEIDIIWWNPWVRSNVFAGDLYHMYGVVERSSGRLLLNNPQFVPISAEQALRNLRLLDEDRLPRHSIMPIYPLSRGLSQAFFRRMAEALLEGDLHRKLADELPLHVRNRLDLPTVRGAMELLHRPMSEEDWIHGRRYMAFQSLYKHQMDLDALRSGRRQGMAPIVAAEADYCQTFDAALPYALTPEQRNALQDILRDIGRAAPAFRLVRGEAGSGKTVVIAGAMLAAARQGVQSALIAPTQLLARQHLESLQNAANALAAGPGEPEIRIELLTGESSAAQRAPILEGLLNGEVLIAVGTTALLQPQVEFNCLGIVAIDEEHRFSVEQRQGLVRPRRTTSDTSPGIPHVISLSATPIPRTLNQVLTGYLDVSEIRNRPGHAESVRTALRSSDDRQQVYSLLRRHVSQGRQGFIVYPQIDALDEFSSVGTLETEFEWLARDVFPDLRLGKAHGGMSKEELETAMAGFQRRDIDLLVATTVIEVGIDVPNATFMLVENAEKFGLAQLHQLRNRVGRGAEAGICILMSEAPSEATSARLQVLLDTESGFEIAEKDLEMRGPGDLLGSRQSGIPDLQYAEFVDDTVLQLLQDCLTLSADNASP